MFIYFETYTFMRLAGFPESRQQSGKRVSRLWCKPPKIIIIIILILILIIILIIIHCQCATSDLQCPGTRTRSEPPQAAARSCPQLSHRAWSAAQSIHVASWTGGTFVERW